jgi:hypothetical protein
LLKHELAARSFVVRTLQRLGLDTHGPPSGHVEHMTCQRSAHL